MKKTLTALFALLSLTAPAMAPSVASFSGGNVSRGTSRYCMVSSEPAESKSPTQSSGMMCNAAACIMPLSAAITRAPLIWDLSRGVTVRSPPSRMAKRVMRPL